MYSPDTLKRLNEEEVKKLRKQASAKRRKGKEKPKCEFCDKDAVDVIPVYNPADKVRGVEGVYSTISICQECLDDGKDCQDDVFICPDCGEHFVINHSWDVLAVDIPGEGYFCQSCAAKRIEPLKLSDLLSNLRNKKTDGFVRLNSVPGKKEIWSGEFAEWSDFPGHTSLDSVANEIEQSAKEAGLGPDSEVYPCITQGYQFSVVLGVFA